MREKQKKKIITKYYIFDMCDYKKLKKKKILFLNSELKKIFAKNHSLRNRKYRITNILLFFKNFSFIIWCSLLLDNQVHSSTAFLSRFIINELNRCTHLKGNYYSHAKIIYIIKLSFALLQTSSVHKTVIINISVSV